MCVQSHRQIKTEAQASVNTQTDNLKSHFLSNTLPLHASSHKSTLLLLFPFFLLLACPAPCRFSALQSLQQLPTPASFYLLSYIASFLHTIFFLRLFSCNCQSFLLLPLFLVPFSFYFLYLSWGSWLDWISVFIVH